MITEQEQPPLPRAPPARATIPLGRLEQVTAALVVRLRRHEGEARAQQGATDEPTSLDGMCTNPARKEHSRDTEGRGRGWGIMSDTNIPRIGT